MKVVRSIILAAALSLAATAAFALGTRDAAASASSSCVLWDYCFCMEVGCSMGDQLCATGPGFECYQWD